MYNKFYKLKENPFNQTPDTRFFFPSQKHTEALSNLIYSVNERKGFVVITGEIGSGKTTVCRVLLNQLNHGARVALINNTHLTKKQLISSILEDLEVPFNNSGTKSQLLSALNKFLIHQLSLDFNVVLIIDEAQNLSPDILEEVRMLSNLETEREKLIQIILLGQPNLRKKLDLKELEQLKQRISLYFHLQPLTKEESREYIHHRLKLSSANGFSPIFSAEALERIFIHSGGIPRLINSICDRALLSGYIKDSPIIGEATIEEAADEIRIKKEN